MFSIVVTVILLIPIQLVPCMHLEVVMEVILDGLSFTDDCEEVSAKV